MLRNKSKYWNKLNKIQWKTSTFDTVIFGLSPQEKNPTRENRCSRFEGFILLSSKILSTTRVPISGSPLRENLGNRRNVRYISLCKSPTDLDNVGEAPLCCCVMPMLQLHKPVWASWRTASPLLCKWSSWSETEFWPSWLKNPSFQLSPDWMKKALRHFCVIPLRNCATPPGDCAVKIFESYTLCRNLYC